MGYQVVEKSNLNNFTSYIEGLMEDGWIPVGSMEFTSSTESGLIYTSGEPQCYRQAMMKPKEKS